MTPESKAAHAKMLLDDPLLVEVLDSIEAAAINAWRATGTAQHEDRERAWYSLKASERVRGVLQSIVDNGLIEARRAVAPR